MPIISLFSGTYCLGEKTVPVLLDRTGYKLVKDRDIVREASEHSPLSAEKLDRALSMRTSLFNSFTGEQERSVSQLRLTLAEKLSQDGLVVDGNCIHLIPRTVSHVLRVCLIADMSSRIDTAVSAESISRTDAAKLIRRQDESRAAWVMKTTGRADPWDPELYDLLIPTDKMSSDEALELITHNLAKEVVQLTPLAKQAVEDFLVASRTERTLALQGHYIDVECADGTVTLTINKHVLMLRRLEAELQRIAGQVEGVRMVTTRVGKDFYQPDIYRKMDFEKPSKVLLVDDEREFVQTLSERLEMRQVGSAIAYDGESALRMVEDDEPDVMILDLKMPGIDGIEVLRRVKQSNPHVEVIILTGHGSDEDCKTCMDLGAFAYLRKPVDIEALSETLKRANEKARASSVARKRTPGGEP